MHKGADGKWTQDATITPFKCPHEWQPYTCEFLTAVYHAVPVYELECKLCKQQITTRVRLFRSKPKCQHEWWIAMSWARDMKCVGNVPKEKLKIQPHKWF